MLGPGTRGPSATPMSEKQPRPPKTTLDSRHSPMTNSQRLGTGSWGATQLPSRRPGWNCAWAWAGLSRSGRWSGNRASADESGLGLQMPSCLTASGAHSIPESRDEAASMQGSTSERHPAQYLYNFFLLTASFVSYQIHHQTTQPSEQTDQSVHFFQAHECFSLSKLSTPSSFR
ncbi:hypothetical protein FALBO_2202 [Fusarium albosuccineum]|uniref:Uncharacterized protein n=1 Tax=Fusarium albosuccineum TaxID=1237068 RepID=A0A8H4PHZ7_9HYPO|nr:hypothetical protein FALBO_2202 [Fusarium albosuccineum]